MYSQLRDRGLLSGREAEIAATFAFRLLAARPTRHGLAGLLASGVLAGVRRVVPRLRGAPGQWFLPPSDRSLAPLLIRTMARISAECGVDARHALLAAQDEGTPLRPPAHAALEHWLSNPPAAPEVLVAGARGPGELAAMLLIAGALRRGHVGVVGAVDGSIESVIESAIERAIGSRLPELAPRVEPRATGAGPTGAAGAAVARPRGTAADTTALLLLPAPPARS